MLNLDHGKEVTNIDKTESLLKEKIVKNLSFE
jgi:hypothetical protein